MTAGSRGQQRAQPGKAVRRDEAERHERGQRLLDLRAQKAAALPQLVEE